MDYKLDMKILDNCVRLKIFKKEMCFFWFFSVSLSCDLGIVWKVLRLGNKYMWNVSNG